MLELRGINNREEGAWQELFSVFYAPLCVYVEKILNNHTDAEDIVQETMMKIWTSAYSFNNEAHLSYYLYRSVHNTTISHIRSRSTQISTDDTPIPDSFDEEAYANAVREELYRNLYVAISNLPLQQRRVIELSIEGKTGREIAEILGISIHTVKAHKQKAIDYLKQNVDKNIYFIAFSLLFS